MQNEKSTTGGKFQRFQSHIVNSIMRAYEKKSYLSLFLGLAVVVSIVFSISCPAEEELEMEKFPFWEKEEMIMCQASEDNLIVPFKKEHETEKKTIISFKGMEKERMLKKITPPSPLSVVHRFPPPYTGPRLIINVAARKLRVYEGKNLVKTYPIAVGTARHKTPLGYREMHRIVWNPWWIPPKKSAWARNAKRTPPGPRNPLGPIKMKLGGAIMVHGTNNSASVGRAASHGCMRMYSDQARELGRYIQEKIMGDVNDKTYAKYKRNRRRSYYINLPVKVPVSIIYEIAEIEDGRLYIYKDIYRRKKDKLAQVRNALILKGYNLDDFNMTRINKKIRSARNRKDINFSLNEVYAHKKGAKPQLAQKNVK